MLVMFVIRGMAYSTSFPRVNESVMNSLKGTFYGQESYIEYKLKRYPEYSRDRDICERIITILRDHDNDKSIPVREAVSDSTSSGEEDVLKDTPKESQKEVVTKEMTQPVEPAQEEKQANDTSVVLKSEAISDEDETEEREEKVDIEEPTKKEEKEESPEEKPEMPVSPVEVVPEETPEKKEVEPSDDEVDEVGEVVPLTTEAMKVEVEDEVDEANPEDEVDEVKPEEEVDEVKPEEVNEVPKQEEEEVIENLPEPTNEESDVDEEDKEENLPNPVSDVDADSEGSESQKENLPMPLSRSESESSLQAPVGDVLPPDEDIITRSNDPPGCDLNPEETPEEIEERKRKKREAKRKAKLDALPPQPSMEPRDVTVQPMSNDLKLKLQAPMSRT